MEQLERDTQEVQKDIHLLKAPTGKLNFGLHPKLAASFVLVVIPCPVRFAGATCVRVRMRCYVRMLRCYTSTRAVGSECEPITNSRTPASLRTRRQVDVVAAVAAGS